MPKLTGKENTNPDANFTPIVNLQATFASESLESSKNVQLNSNININNLTANYQFLQQLNSARQTIVFLLASSGIYLANVTADTTKVKADNINVTADRT